MAQKETRKISIDITIVDKIGPYETATRSRSNQQFPATVQGVQNAVDWLGPAVDLMLRTTSGVLPEEEEEQK